ncbi:CBL-interacting serine/threonine-protein kinase 23 [Asimina triloba]
MNEAAWVKNWKKGEFIMEIAPSLCMVELRKSGGDTLEFHEFYKNLSTGLKDIVWKSGGESSTSSVSQDS